jgi:hypothetical protein
MAAVAAEPPEKAGRSIAFRRVGVVTPPISLMKCNRKLHSYCAKSRRDGVGSCPIAQLPSK